MNNEAKYELQIFASNQFGQIRRASDGDFETDKL